MLASVEFFVHFHTLIFLVLKRLICLVLCIFLADYFLFLVLILLSYLHKFYILSLRLLTFNVIPFFRYHFFTLPHWLRQRLMNKWYKWSIKNKLFRNGSRCFWTFIVALNTGGPILKRRITFIILIIYSIWLIHVIRCTCLCSGVIMRIKNVMIFRYWAFAFGGVSQRE